MSSPTTKIFKKETREMMRDKRVRSAAFFTPILLVVMFLMMFGFLLGSFEPKKGETLHVINASSPLADPLSKAYEIKPVASVAEAEQKIREGSVKLVLELPKDTATDTQVQIQAYFDEKQERGKMQLSAIRGLFSEINKKSLEQTLSANEIDPMLAERIKLVEKPVRVGGEKAAGELVVSLLPYLIVIWAFYGGFGIAGDLVAGEKEKQTLETLLISPISRTQIAMGKFWSLGLICLLSSLSSLVGVILVALLRLPNVDKLFPNGLALSPVAIGTMIAVLLPTVAMFAAVMVAVSTYARNMREAQTYLTLVSFLVITPAVFSQFIGFTDFATAKWINAVPILNTATAIRNALLDRLAVVDVGITIGVNLVLAVAAIVIAVRLFNREKVLTRV